MMSVQNVAVLGASGNLGPSIVTALIQAGLNVTILVRPSSTSTAPPGATVIKTDYTHSSLRSALKGQDAVISTLNPQAWASGAAAIDIAAELGIRRFIPSEFGSDTSNPRVRELVPIFEGKKKYTDYLRSKESAGLSWTALATGPFLDWGISTGFLGFDVKNRKAEIWDGGDVPFSGTTLAGIGKAVVQVLKNLEATKNQYVFVESTTTTQNEIVKGLERLTGEKFEVTEVVTRDRIATNLEKLGKGDYSVIGEVIKEHIFIKDEPLADWKNLEGGNWNERIGLETEKLEEVLKTVV